MNELVMMEAALFQLRAALTDDPSHLEMRLGANVLGGAIATAKENGVNAARVSDIEFALNDLAAAAENETSEAIRGALEMLQQDLQPLRAATMLAPEIAQGIAALSAKLRERKNAIERAQYRLEGSSEPELPHPPEELRMEAIPLARQLAGAGFDTPALDLLVADPDELRYHSLVEIINELEVISG
ncbi:MAG TPA: hypothetical protein VF111_14500 [Thermoanaerobaculia bacterium]